jgi:two-component system heavy metal sensor histidine kinase CusS
MAARLTAWHAGSTCFMVAIATSSLYMALQHHLATNEDAALTDQVQVLRSNLEHAPDLRVMLQREVIDELAVQRSAQAYIRILDAHGAVIIETPGMGSALPAAAFPIPAPAGDGSVQGVQVATRTGEPFRIAAGAAPIPGSGIGTLQVALGDRQEQELLASYRTWMVLLLGLTVAVSIAGGYLLARRGLRPLHRFSVAIRSISPARLNERIPVASLPQDLAVVGESFNAMLTRLEDAFARLRRFSADIAHELRTPMNNLRGETEVALGRARTPDEYREVLASSLEECQKLTRLIDTLLFLARAESPEQHLDREAVILGAELEIVSHFYAPMADEAGIHLSVAAGEPATVRGDRTLLQRAIGNLVENALAHTPSGGRIVLSMARCGDQVDVAVADSGQGIPSAHLPYVFDRFHRVDQARSNAGGHVGLGLAIVQSIAVLHGGTARIDSVVASGTTVTIRLPLGPGAMPAASVPA